MASDNDSDDSDLGYSSGPEEEQAGPDSHVPFEQLLQQRQQGPKPLSTRSVREARETEPGSPGGATAKAVRKQFKRESKNRSVWSIKLSMHILGSPDNPGLTQIFRYALQARRTDQQEARS